VVIVMSSSPHSTIVSSDSDIEDAFSSTNILNYFPASPGNIFPNPFEKISSPKDTKNFCFQISLHHPTKSRDEISVRLGDYNNP
ncbi:hypothetical protein Tco_0197030, partial [Tanacetum coccineum]